MAYSANLALSLLEQDGSGGQRSVSASASAIVPTKPAFCGTGTATTSYAAISYGSVTTPKAVLIINDGAVELTYSLDAGSTDNGTIGVTGSTSKLNFMIIPVSASAPRLKTASSTAVYRTFILE